MKHRAILLAGIALLALSACSEEKAAEAPPPPPPAASEPAPAPAPNKTDEAVNKLREGAASMKEGAKALLEQGRAAAERALEDAGPTLEKAGEAARQIGTAVDEIARRARADLEKAVDDLNRRIAEKNGEQASAPAGDPAARLAERSLLNADTLAAARARPAGVGPDYVGVWAGTAADCKRIDQEPVELFAVITPTTIRRHESVCNFSAAPLEAGSATVAASCIAEGESEDRQISLAVPSADALEIGYPGAPAQVRLVRCSLPD